MMVETKEIYFMDFREDGGHDVTWKQGRDLWRIRLRDNENGSKSKIMT